MSAVAELLKTFSPDTLGALVAQLDEEEQGELYALIEQDEQDDIVRRCSERVVSHSAGPMYFLRQLTKTTNFHWEKQNLPPKAPFPYRPYPAGLNPNSAHPDWDYLDWIMFYLLDSYERGYDLYLPKCREMMTSYTVVGYCLTMCQFFPNIECVWQSEKDEKAKGLIEYANALYDNQEPWLKKRFPLARGESGTQHEIRYSHNSKCIAVPAGERQTASHHPTIYFNDESAHQAAWKATLNIVKPVAKQIICVSSAAYSEFGLACDPALAA